MKKVLLLTLALGFFFPNITYSQTVNDILIKDIDVDYIQFVGTGKLFSNKVKIKIDFGQENSLWSGGKDLQLRNKDGKRMEFNSMVDALNFFSKNGYDFVSAYALTEGNRNVYHYLLKKTSG